MEKTKFGISTALLGAIIYFACYYGGITPTLLIVGAVLLIEENAQIKKIAVTAATLVFVFAVLSTLISLLPSCLSCLDNILAYFDGYFDYEFISQITNTLNIVVNLLEKLLFIYLGISALGNKNVTIKAVDNFVDKHIAK